MNRIVFAFLFLVSIILCLQVQAQEDSTALANQQKIMELRNRLDRLSVEEDGDETVRRLTDVIRQQSEIIQQQGDTIRLLTGKGTPEKVHYERNANIGKCDCIRVYYDLGRSTANYIKYPALDSIALLAKADPGLKIKLAGHADRRGNQAANEALALKRAVNLKNYLQRKYEIGVERILITSSGSREGIEEVTDPYLYHLNRRVEVSVLRE